MPPARRDERGKCGHCRLPLFVSQPLVLDATRFERHAQSVDLPLLVDFWAPWCGPCRAMAPVFETAAKECEPKLRLAKVDTDAEPELAARYHIQAIPTLVLFKSGRELARHSGALSGSDLRRWIQQQVI